jgi:hypothetical protein
MADSRVSGGAFSEPTTDLEVEMIPQLVHETRNQRLI